MIGRIMLPMLCPANITLAMGTPLARLFFEPQKVIAISSGSGKAEQTAAKHRNHEHDRQNYDINHQ